MPFVLDASVAMAWCFDDETNRDTEAALDRLRDDPAVVPGVWAYEVANVVLMAERRGKLTEFQATRFIELLGRLPINVDLEPPQISTVLAVGRRHGLTAYDAAYLVIAERDGIPLATKEENLRAAAAAAGVPLLIG
jgi:predicted nucleic acid-binding protein